MMRPNSRDRFEIVDILHSIYLGDFRESAAETRAEAGICGKSSVLSPVSAIENSDLYQSV